jgi:hypothetical protein
MRDRWQCVRTLSAARVYGPNRILTLFASFLSWDGKAVTLKALSVLINDDKLLCRRPARPDDAAEGDCRFSNFN